MGKNYPNKWTHGTAQHRYYDKDEYEKNLNDKREWNGIELAVIFLGGIRNYFMVPIAA